MKSMNDIRHMTKTILFFILYTINASCSDIGILTENYMGQSRIVFYGIVLDQHGKPVEGAEVLYEVESFGLPVPRFSKGSVKSKGDGHFTIREGRGSQLFINDIRLKHGEYALAGQIIGYEYRKFYTDCFKPDKDKPVVFNIRRKEAEATFLERYSYIKLEIPANDSENWRGWDLNGGDTVEPRFRENRQYYHDLEIIWKHNQEKKEWTMTFKSNGENAGLQFLDEKLYMAPADGYVKEAVMTFRYSNTLPLKYLYLRLRTPGMYARIDIERAVANEKHFFLRGSEIINPYGDRCLEELELDINIPEMAEKFTQCSHEAQQAMREQRLAPRPPFEQWIKEGKAKY